MNKKLVIFIALLVVIVVGFNIWKRLSLSSQLSAQFPSSNLEIQYKELGKQHSLKYATADDAVKAFRAATDPNMVPVRIATYVPGKLPREDGDPYFIGRGVINQKNNDCIVGYMNLVTGITESHHDVCVIYD